MAQRLIEARADRERVAAQVEAIGELVASEHADVERLTRGVGGFFRRLVASRGELTTEQQELAAARLQHEALLDEQRAIDVDLAQLDERAARLRGAATKYAAVLAELEAAISSGSPHAARLGALADTDGRLRSARRELDEAIAAGRAAHDALLAVQLAVTSSWRAAYGSDVASSLADGLLGSVAVDLSEHVVHEGLRTQLATAQHALLGFQRECKDVAHDAAIDGVSLTPLPSLTAMIARDLLWTTTTRIDDVGAEVEMMASWVASTTMELRGRIPAIEHAAAAVAVERAALLDQASDGGT